MHVIRILRDYLGLSQTELSKRSGLAQADISEMEHNEPYGTITKYERLAAALNTSIQSLLMNDPNSVPLSFFEGFVQPMYTAALPMDHTILGRQGEELALQMEQEKLAETSEILAKLVLPYYKMKVPSPGFDILSYKQDGTPLYIEVKTTEREDASSFQLTNREHDTAEKLSKNGATYLVYHFSGWGSINQKLNIYNYEELVSQNRVSPVKYVCRLTERAQTVSGIIHFRENLNISQAELAARTGIPVASLCKYELGTTTISVDACIKLANFFHVPIDKLLTEYPTFS